MLIIVHGGAGEIKRVSKRREGLIKACQLGYLVLKNGGSAIDAVEHAVIELEDNPLFNAGTGATLSINGEAELDAAIMLDDLKCGSVACIKGVKNPVSVARKVLEETDHIILAGKEATKFARKFGFKPYNPITRKRKIALERGIKELKMGKAPKYLPKLKRFIDSSRTVSVRDEYGTVGACAIDNHKRLVSGTSTGGMFMHLPGRVGDTPIPGAGTYASKSGAVSCTGHGECIIKLCLAKITCDAMEKLSAQEAVNRSLKIATKYKCRCGLIAIDKSGNVGLGFNTPQMLWAYIKDDKLNHF
ncbi:isoaspartyl peptidase/L-asparaginase [candidate division WOR-3 bacterium]|nr:isoaspartyl peptidase/L-asparaginase [candidate division WOR-3 bacterium]